MAISFETLTAEVLDLPPEQRSELVERVLASLDTAPIDDEWARAWADEADRREAEIAAGRAQLIPGDEAIARLRAKLK